MDSRVRGIAIKEIQRLLDLGWKAPAKRADGIRWVSHDTSEISYPRNVLSEPVNSSEDSSFWLDSRADVAHLYLEKYKIETIWDIGAGGGAMVHRLGKRGIEVLSVEPLPEGAASIALVGGEVFCSTLQDLMLPSNSIPAISLFDVLEHLEEPTELLKEVYRVLKPGGLLLVSVPAFQFLWSAEDEALGHFRRYSKASLASLIGGKKRGVSVLSTRYFFASLVPLAFLIRTIPYRLRINRSSTDVISTNTSRLAPSRLVNSLARFTLGIELRLAKLVALPFGLSVFALGEKTRESH